MVGSPLEEGLEGKRLAEAWTTAALGPMAGVLSSAGVGANDLGDACDWAERAGPGALDVVRDAMDAVLLDIAAYEHEQALRGLKA